MYSERFFGVGEPLIQREGDIGVPAAAYLDLVKGWAATPTAPGCTFPMC